MTITRIFENGTELRIPMTDSEIEQAYRERRLYYNIEDIKSRMETYIDDDMDDDEVVEVGSVETTAGTVRKLLKNDEWLKSCAEYFDEKLSDNDSFMESFWLQAEYCIEESIEGEE